MSETLIDNEGMLLKNFVCDCGAIQHGMGVLLVEGEIIFDWYVEPFGFWGKLKQVWGILRGQGVSYHEFVLRKEDIQELIDMLEQAKEGRKGAKRN